LLTLDSKLQKAKAKRQKILRNSISIVGILILILSIELLHRYRYVRRTRNELAIKNKVIYKRYNQNGLLFVGKERFNQLYDSIKNVIKEKSEMSRLEFYFLTAPLVSSLQDDRSFYSLVGKYAFNPQNETHISFHDKTLIPLYIYSFNDSIFTLNDTSELYKAQIISINDISANIIFSTLLGLTQFSKFNYYDKHQYGRSGLYIYPFLSHELFGFKNDIQIKYKPLGSDSILQTKLELLHVGDSIFFNKLKKDRISRTWYNLDVENDYAILYLKSLPEGEVNIHFFNDIFRKINKIQPKALIIDISNCAWSFDTFWLVLLNYIYEGKLWLYEYHKEARDISKYLKKRLKNKKYIVGNFSEINNDYRFSGDLYLITGPNTKSSAVRFADILRYNHIVKKIYGSETLSKTTQYDFANSYFLPITGIQLVLSTSLSYSLDKNTDTHGLRPDIEVKPRNVSEFFENSGDRFVAKKVIELIESEKQENENTSD